MFQSSIMHMHQYYDVISEFDGTVFGLAEEPGRIVVTESTAGVSSLPILAHKSVKTPVVRVGVTSSNPNHSGNISCPFSPVPSKCALFTQSSSHIFLAIRTLQVYGALQSLLELCLRCSRSEQQNYAHFVPMLRFHEESESFFN